MSVFVKDIDVPGDCDALPDILACPHCGGRAEVLMGVVTVFVACRNCGSRGKAYRFRWFDEDSYRRAEDRAVRSWNRRLRHG